jgi:hypothetical protein
MFHRVASPGIMGLLKQALAAQKGGFRAALCGALHTPLVPCRALFGVLPLCLALGRLSHAV